MDVTILNGNPDCVDKGFDARTEETAEMLRKRGCRVTIHILREHNLRMCKGCFGCWHRTPGECVHQDDTPTLLRSVINADFLLLASPVRAGFVTPLVKTAVDKFLALLHPYVCVKNGEMRHRRRYPKYPDWGVLLDRSGDTDDEDVEIITECMRRATLNFHSTLRFSKLITDAPEEISDAVVRA